MKIKKINIIKSKKARLNKTVLKPKFFVNPEEEAEWIIENCTDKFSKDEIMEILDYEMGYLATLGLVDISAEEFQENLEYWANRNG